VRPTSLVDAVARYVRAGSGGRRRRAPGRRRRSSRSPSRRPPRRCWPRHRRTKRPTRACGGRARTGRSAEGALLAAAACGAAWNRLPRVGPRPAQAQRRPTVDGRVALWAAVARARRSASVSRKGDAVGADGVGRRLLLLHAAGLARAGRFRSRPSPWPNLGLARFRGREDCPAVAAAALRDPPS